MYGALSTTSIARATPAQNPRSATRTCRCGGYIGATGNVIYQRTRSRVGAAALSARRAMRPPEGTRVFASAAPRSQAAGSRTDSPGENCSVLLTGRPEQDLVDVHVLRLAHREHDHAGERVGGDGRLLVEP